MRRSSISSTTIILLAFFATSPAQGWEVGSTEVGCEIFNHYEGAGETRLGLFEELDGRLNIFISNYNWSIEDKKMYPVRLVLDSNTWSGDAMGHRDTNRTFGLPVSQSFRPAFGKSNSLGIYMGDGVLIDRLSLRGSSAALKMLDACMVKLRKASAVAGALRNRLADIPSDPFQRPEPSVGPHKAKPRSSAASWVSGEDYPIQLMAANVGGKVTIRATVDQTGRISDCIVTGSSGNSVLDEATCAIISRRGRFEPARDEEGRPTKDVFEHSIFWKAPG